jgi:nitric oxide dioxygenase
MTVFDATHRQESAGCHPPSYTRRSFADNFHHQRRSMMQQPLSPQTIAIVKATVPALAEHGTTITKLMYARLFRDEHIRALFNHANQGDGGAQVHALAAAILTYARHIEDLGALAPVVERVAHKHIGFHILPEHYPYVATALLSAIADVLGDAATDEIINA